MKKLLIWALPALMIGLTITAFRPATISSPNKHVSASVIPSGNFTMDMAHSQILFKVKHMGISTVTGWFAEGQAKVAIPQANLSTMRVDATIKSTSINTNNSGRDNHLRSAEFFDAANFPTVTFKSTRVVGRGNNFTMYGDLTMHGVTKRITLAGKYLGSVTTQQGTKIAFESTGRINRKDFGVSWSGTMDNGGLMVSDEVDITLAIEANKDK